MSSRTSRRFRPLPLAAAIAMALVPATSQAVTYFVTSGLDNGGVNPAPGAGTGTLRQAIIDANANCASDPTPVIEFAIGASATFIGIGSPAATTANPLPALVCTGFTYSPTIDASTQPGYVPNTDSTGFNGVYGISLLGSGLTSGGVCGFSFPQNITDGGALTVRGFYFNGFAPVNNGAVCGTNMNIFGNHFDQGYEGVKVLGNGTAQIGNTSAADRNFFTLNSAYGINIQTANSVNVTNNFIGTTDGVNPAPNGIGVFAAASAAVQVTSSVISGNNFEGIRLIGTPGSIMGNQIGVGIFGGVLSNATGIRIDSAGPTVIQNNSIVHNNVYGVHVASGVGVRMTQNSITANGSANVTLDMYGGPVPNDVGDGDTGPNNRQNYPVVTSATSVGLNTTYNFTFNSTPSSTFNLDFYDTAAPGIPGGETMLGTTTVTTDGAGNSTLTSFSLPFAASNVSMTARALSGDTSEFSPLVATTAGAPAVSVTPAALNFGNVPVNTTSGNLTTTLQSVGGTAYQISQLSTGSCYGGPICYGGAEFTCSTTCATFTPYAPGASCTITANFHPTFLGPQTTNLVVCDNASGSPRTIVISGNGVVAPTLAATPSFIDFGDVPVGSTSPARFVTVQNPGASPVTYTTATNGPFAVLGTNCANPIPAGGSCDFDVGFAPTAGGLASGNFVVSPSSGTPSTVSLQGNGITAPVLGAPAQIDIGYTLGRPPTTQRVTLSNNGSAPLDFTSITIQGANFTLANQCPSQLGAGSSCDVLITFSADTIGTFNGSLTVVTNAPGGSRVIPIRGFAQPREVPFLEITPREIGYGNLAFGRASDGEVVRVRNIGGAPAVFDSLVVSADFVILSHDCTAPLAPQATCQALVAMRPLSYGPRFGAFTVRSNAENSPTSIEIFGTSCRSSSLVLPRLGAVGGC